MMSLRWSAVGLIGLSGVFAQDHVVVFGAVQYDSAAYTLPTIGIDASVDLLGIFRSDGRGFVLGSGAFPHPGDAPAGVRFVRMELLARSGLMLTSVGTLEAWGERGGLVPPVLPPATLYVDMAAGAAHALALRSDGVVVAFGEPANGRTTVPALPPGVSVTGLYAAGGWSLLRLSDGTMVAFGSNSNGQLLLPPLAAGLTWRDVWIGPTHAMARRSDGPIITWGSNTFGQNNVPRLPAGVTWSTMAMGLAHTVGLRSDGVVQAWGENSAGQCDVPPMPAGLIVQVAAGQSFSAARFGDGRVVVWGSAGYLAPLPALATGEHWMEVGGGVPHPVRTSAGRIAMIGSALPAPPPLPTGITYTRVWSGYGHSVALRSDGRAVAWGLNSAGQCAIPPLPPGMRYLDGVAGEMCTVLLRSDGLAITCGTPFGPPIPLPPLGTSYVEVRSSGNGALLRRSDGALVAVGVALPTLALPPGVACTSVALGNGFAAALGSDGGVYMESALRLPLPPLPPGVVYVEIDARGSFLAARRSDGVGVSGTMEVQNPIANLYPLRAGESVLQVDLAFAGLGALRVGPTSTYVTFAGGCAGTLPAARLVPRDTPRAGRELVVTLFDLPRATALMAFGLRRVGPVSLAGVGMPGCAQMVAVDALTLVVGNDGSAEWRLPIPDAPTLVGVSFHNQALVFDPGANAAGMVASDAATGVVGRD